MKPESSLEQYQQLFMQAMLNVDSNGEGNMSLTNSYLAGSIEKIIGPEKRIEVYQTNYQLALVRCLQSSFLQTFRILGEVSFNAIAMEYITLYPSQSENLNGYGEKFPQFVSNNFEQEREARWLKDIAHSDYLKQCCYYAKNNSYFPLNTFMNMPVEVQLLTKMNRQPSLYLQESFWDLANIDFITSESSTCLNEDTAYFLYYRNEGKVQIRVLEKSVFELLALFNQDTCMNDLNEKQLEKLPMLIGEGWLKMAGAML
ncbi:MAG: DNA-binding domain-containing protein [Bermanella sp.]